MKKHISQNANFTGWKPVLLVAMALLLSGAAPVWADGDEPDSLDKTAVVRPNESYQGKSYAEWSAEWWQWFMEFPVQDAQGNPLPHPSFDDPQVNVRDGQHGNVWFLGAVPFGTVERTHTIPKNKALFLAILNAEASDLEGLGETEAEQRDTAKFLADHIVNPFCSIDGVPVKRLDRFRVSSPQFDFTAPTPWVFGTTGGDGTAVSDGYFVLIKPLSKGQHTIHYGGSFHFSVAEGDPFDFDASIDMTYHLKVQ